MRDQILLRIKMGRPPLQENEEMVPCYTFAEDAQAFIDACDLERSTLQDYVLRINKYWLPHFGIRQTGSITAREIKDVLAKATVTNKTKKNLLIPLKGIFDHAEVTPNPASAVKVRKQPKKLVKRFSPMERDLVLSKLTGQHRLYFEIAFGIGARPGGEILGLKWTDYEDGKIHIQRTIVRRKLKTSTKTGEERRVIVPHWLREKMDTARPDEFTDEPWIFQNSLGSHHKDADLFNAAWQKVFKDEDIVKAGMEYRVPYVCRHTRAAELLSRGVKPASAAMQLGHSVEMFLRTYSEWIEEYSDGKDSALIAGNPNVSQTCHKTK